MTRTAVNVLGVVFVLIGIAGFIPALSPDDQVFSLFQVDALHNVVHLLSGIAALAAANAGYSAARMYAQVFGVVYAVITLYGFVIGEGELLGFLPVNQADNVLHLVLAVVLLYLGFSTPAEKPRRDRSDAAA